MKLYSSFVHSVVLTILGLSFAYWAGNRTGRVVAAVVQAPTDSVTQADTIAAFPGCKGPGCMAFEGSGIRDSVIFGGDGVRGNADDWGADSVRVWKITVCPEYGVDDLNAPGTRSAAFDSAANYPTSWNFIESLVDGACADTAFDATALKNTYIAGQTERNSEGATFFAGAGWEFERVGTTRSQDVVMRYIRTRSLFNQGIAVWAIERGVFDHVSASWAAAAGGQHVVGAGGDSTTQTTNTFVDQMTYSNVLVYEPRADHPGTFGFYASPRDEPAMRRSSLHNVTVLGRGHRCPNISGGDTIIASNLIAYNCVDRQIGVGNQMLGDIIGVFNHVGPGTATGQGRERPVWVLDSCSYPGNVSLSSTGDSTCVQSWYISRVSFIWPAQGDTFWNVSGVTNLYKGSDSLVVCRDITDTPTGYLSPPWNCVTHGDTVHTGRAASTVKFTATDFGMPAYMYPDTSGFADSAAVIAQVNTAGAYRRLQCDGTWAAARDTVDRDMVGRFLNDLRETTPVGISGWVDNDGFTASYTNTSIGAALGADTVALDIGEATATKPYVGPDSTATLSLCTDADGDGMPATFEALYASLSDADATDVVYDGDFDGYIALEEYLNGTNPEVFTSAEDGSEAATICTTYGGNGGVCVYRAPISGYDTIYRDTLTGDTVPPSLSNDTIVVQVMNTDSIPPGSVGRECWNNPLTTRYLVTEDPIAGGNLIDSANADTMLNNITHMPGCDTAYVKDTVNIPNN